MPRRFLPTDMKRAANAYVKCCKRCKSNSGYKAPQPNDIPDPLRDLSAEIVEALKPLHADPGPYQRADHGYRIHTGMTRILFADKPVKEKIDALSSGTARSKARRFEASPKRRKQQLQEIL